MESNGKESPESIQDTAEIISFLTLWDEELGPVIVDFYPRYNVGDIEDLAIQIFTGYQYFWDMNIKYQQTKFILPIKTLNRKSKNLLDVVANSSVRGGFQPYIVVLLVPDYLTDEQLTIFDGVMLKISQSYYNKRTINMEEYYQEIRDVLLLKTIESEKKEEISELYSYTAAMEDFQAGIKLFQTKNLEQAYKLLRKVLAKFEQEEHQHLMLEVLYILASLFTQKRQFSVAKNYFNRLESLATKLENEKYLELGTFMNGFCSYKNEFFIEALKKFEKIDVSTSKFINKLQFHAIFGRVYIKLGKHEAGLQEFLKALIISTEMGNGNLIKRQQAQILFDIGDTNFKLAVETLKKEGIKEKKSYLIYLQEAINNLERSAEIILELNDHLQLISVYQLIVNIFEFLGDDKSYLEYLEKSLEISIKIKNSAKELKITKLIIQKQTKLGKHEDNVIRLKKLLNNINNLKFVDLYTIATFHKQLGEAYIAIDNFNETIPSFLKALEIFQGFQVPIIEELEILNKLVQIYIYKNEMVMVSKYSNMINDISDRKYDASIQKPKIFRPLGDLAEFWIFNTSTSVELFNYAPESEVDSDLLGGFLTAIQQFSLELSQKYINDLVIGESRYMIFQESGYDFYILGRANRRVPIEVIKSILSKVFHRFWKEYAEEIKHFLGATTPYRSFTKIIESLDLTLIK